MASDKEEYERFCALIPDGCEPVTHGDAYDLFLSLRAGGMLCTPDEREVLDACAAVPSDVCEVMVKLRQELADVASYELARRGAK